MGERQVFPVQTTRITTNEQRTDRPATSAASTVDYAAGSRQATML